MAIQVTGSLQVGLAYYKDPIIELIPHLTYRGSIAMDANICAPSINPETSSSYYSQVSTIPYYPQTSELQYPTSPVDPYSDLIYALETFVIENLQPFNSGSTFNRF
jgi:hypothetical protein